ncbi:MAG: pentapeptide repeat-containing protein, partial [Candidatus Neomarinimicrobiota bacterium]
LRTDQLGGADITNAILPREIADFTGLGVIEEASKNARKLFLAMLLGCVYGMLTIATTTDARLITNSASSPLPVIGAEIPIVGFYWVAPVLLAGLYIYFHLSMLRIWEGLAGLPAIFIDGISVDQKIYPWLLLGLVRRQFVRLREKPLPLGGVQFSISVLLAWWSVPLTLMLFWLRYIPKHEWGGTLFQMATITVTAGVGTTVYQLMKLTLRGRRKGLLPIRIWRRLPFFYGAILLAILGVFAHGAIYGSGNIVHSNPRIFTHEILEVFAFGAVADLGGADLSDADLSFKNLNGAYLVNAHLTGANLHGANLHAANLSGAVLDDADLTLADLREARVRYIIEKRAIRSIKGANIHMVVGASEGRVEWAKSRGAVEIKDDEEWKDYRKKNMPESGSE